MMDVTGNPNVSGWSMAGGYKDDMSVKLYPRRVFNPGERASLVIFLRLYADDLEYVCQGTGLGFKVILSMRLLLFFHFSSHVNDSKKLF